MPHDYEAGYKRLFAAPGMVRDLLLGFVGHDWAESADFASLCRLNGSYVGDELPTCHDEMVWKIRLCDEWRRSVVRPYGRREAPSPHGQR